MDKEIWRPVKGYVGHYEVSNMGNVKSVERLDTVKRRVRERILIPHIEKRGYKRVRLCIYGKCNMWMVHQLVAIAFLNHRVNGMKMVINHIDGNASNNRIENLEIVTQRENSSTCIRKYRRKKSSEYVGVCWCKKSKKWLSHIQVSGRLKHLGCFDDELEAAKAYQVALADLKQSGMA